MELRCQRCKVLVGILTKGKLRKGSVQLCAKCAKIREAAENVMECSKRGDTLGLFGGIFK